MDLIKKAIIDYITSLKYLRSTKLYFLLIIPGLISFILGSLFLYLAYLSGTYIADSLSSLYPFEFGKKAAYTFFHFMPFTYILAIMLVKYVIYVCISPFMAVLSKKIALSYDADDTDSISYYGFKRIIKISLRSFYKEILWTILFSAVGIIVPVAGIVGFIITQSYYIGILHLDYTLSKKMNFNEMLSWIKSNRGLPLGNGFIYITLIFIPFFGLFLAPIMATAAGVISVKDALEKVIV